MLPRSPLRYLLLPLASAALLAGSANAANITAYTDAATWTAAAGSHVVTEDFSGATLVPGFSVVGGSIGSGVYSGEALPGVFPASDRDGMSFLPGTLAFGADWDLSPGGPGAGIGFTLTFTDSTTQDFFGITNPAAGGTFSGFFGLVSDAAISSISLYTGSFTGNGELFNMDNARFAGDGGGHAPEPGSLALFLVAGLGLLGVSSRNLRQRS